MKHILLSAVLSLSIYIIQAQQSGERAPSFNLESSNGKKYTLNDFKGKLVYVDLWASWCEPCRKESPFMKALAEKYKGTKDLVFLSISLDKDIKKWKKALKEDKPDWVQLIDKDQSTINSFGISLIPKFILIDGYGNIVSSDAPRPSYAEKLDELLKDELAKMNVEAEDKDDIF